MDALKHINHRTLEVNGIRIHIAEQGSGPLLLLLHGFPSLWYSWRHQIPFFAKEGFHVVAPDLRGYGQSDVPADQSQYTYLHIAGDVIGIIDALGKKQAFVAGHDWGSIIASSVALFRPDLVRALINFSAPFSARDANHDMVSGLRKVFGDGIYMNQWQRPEEGEGEADFERHGMKAALTRLYCLRDQVPQSKNGKTVLDDLPLPDKLPAWLSEEDIQYFADNFNKTGITAPLNYYRNIRRSWELMAPWTNQGTNVPILFITGDMDLCVPMTLSFVESPLYKQLLPNFKGVITLPGVGHFAPEESSSDVNNHMLKFFKENYF